MFKRFDPEADYESFESWFHDLTEEKYGQYSFAWQESLQKGAVIQRSGYSDFQGWLYDNKWPEIRMNLELIDLLDRAEAARWADFGEAA